MRACWSNPTFASCSAATTSVAACDCPLLIAFWMISRLCQPSDGFNFAELPIRREQLPRQQVAIPVDHRDQPVAAQRLIR